MLHIHHRFVVTFTFDCFLKTLRSLR